MDEKTKERERERETERERENRTDESGSTDVKAVDSTRLA